MRFLSLILICIITLHSCINQNSGNDNYNETIKDTISEELEPQVIDASNDTINPNILDFRLSPCKHACHQDTGKVLENYLQNETLHIRIGHFLNCIADDSYMKDFILNGDTINLIIKRPYVLDTFEGKVWESAVAGYAACDCYYEIETEIYGIKKEISEILVNGYKLENTGP